jgi:hypothetical protein
LLELDCELFIRLEAEEFFEVFSASVKFFAQLQKNNIAIKKSDLVIFIKSVSN